MNKRQNHSGAFKAKVVLEAFRGEKTLCELSSKYGVHANLIAQWKKRAVEGLGDVFSSKASKAKSSHDLEIKELQAKVGELTMERDFLSKAFGR